MSVTSKLIQLFNYSTIQPFNLALLMLKNWRCSIAAVFLNSVNGSVGGSCLVAIEERSNEPLNFWTFEPLNFWTFELLNFWTFEPLNFWTFEHWTFELWTLNLELLNPQHWTLNQKSYIKNHKSISNLLLP